MINILNLIPNNHLIDLFMVSATLVVLILGIINIVSYHKFSYLSLPILVVLDGLVIGLPELFKGIYIIYDVLFVGIIIVAIVEFCQNVEINKKVIVWLIHF